MDWDTFKRYALGAALIAWMILALTSEWGDNPYALSLKAAISP